MSSNIWVIQLVLIVISQSKSFKKKGKNSLDNKQVAKIKNNPTSDHSPYPALFSEESKGDTAVSGLSYSSRLPFSANSVSIINFRTEK